MTMNRHTIKIGTVDRQGVFVELEIRDARHGQELSICANIKRSGHCVGGGQSLDTVRRVALHGTPTVRRKAILRLLTIWERWHLNGLNAGCEHQRAADWDPTILLDRDKPASRSNMAIWTYRDGSTEKFAHDTHPLGLMCEPCWICGYKYGTEWLHEELPTEIIAEIQAWPGTA